MSIFRGLRGAPFLAAQLDGPPEGGRWAQWIGGVVLALAAAIAGIVAIAIFHIATGVFLIFLGWMLHFHYFWGLHPKLCAFSGLGKNVAALGMILPILYGFYCLYYSFVHM
jgi:hypothetical protein